MSEQPLSDALVSKMSLFYPRYLKRQEAVRSRNGRFVYYTSADTAMQVITKKAVWLRNARSMNDFSEVEHGFTCFKEAFSNSDEGQSLQRHLKQIFPNIVDKWIKHINGWLPILRKSTYMICVSEHDKNEDAHGRLSMWRAYGSKHSVALVLNNGPFLNDTDAFNAWSFPVEYQDSDFVKKELASLETRLKEHQDFTKELGEKEVFGWLCYVSKLLILCVKHPGFKEEREWRVIYTPDMEDPTDHIKSDIVSLNGVPQQIYKIPLQNIPEENFNGATIPEFVDRIIIGPSDEAPVLLDAFRKLLKEAGCKDADSKVHYSGIPLR